MRIAVIADLHGELRSFEAVLADIEREGVNQIVCLGDVAGLGAHPHEVTVRLRELGCPVVMGNADEFLLDPTMLAPERHPDADESLRRMHDMELWCAAQLTDEDRAFIRTFRATVEIPLEGDASLLCYHGSPRSATEHIRGATPDAELSEMLGTRCAVMAGGHTHDQFLRRLDSTIVINPGSVGLAYETLQEGGDRNPPWAEYAMLTFDSGRIDVSFRRVPVDAERIRRDLLESGIPHAEWWAADRR